MEGDISNDLTETKPFFKKITEELTEWTDWQGLEGLVLLIPQTVLQLQYSGCQNAAAVFAEINMLILKLIWK